MAVQKLSLRTQVNHQGQRLDAVLAEWLPQALKMPLSKAKVRQLIVAGAVYLNRKRVRIASKTLLANAVLDVFLDIAKLFPPGGAQSGHQHGMPRKLVSLTAERILFEDEFLIAVDKPPGLPTQPTVDEARENLFAAMKKFLADREKVAVTQIYLGLHHRLDSDTSGVILFTKAQAANAGVGEIFSRHLAQKTYQALVMTGRESLPAKWFVENHLGKVSKRGKKAVFGAVKSGGDFAHTDFELIENFVEAGWVQARPRTGRTHQIRVHLSEEGNPILGDSLYGGAQQLRGSAIQVPRLCLHASRLTFPHPITKNEISIESPLPQDILQCLQQLRMKP